MSISQYVNNKLFYFIYISVIRDISINLMKNGIGQSKYRNLTLFHVVWSVPAKVFLTVTFSIWSILTDHDLFGSDVEQDWSYTVFAVIFFYLNYTLRRNWPIRSITRILYHQVTRYNSLWLWRWLPRRLSKRRGGDSSNKGCFGRKTNLFQECGDFSGNRETWEIFREIWDIIGTLRKDLFHSIH